MENLGALDSIHYDWETLSRTNLFSSEELCKIQDRFPDIHSHFPKYNTTCLGTSKIDWSNFHLHEFHSTIESHESTRNFYWPR